MKLTVFLLCNCFKPAFLSSENLFHCPVGELSPIRHWEVGKYFQAYTGSCYVPNHALLEKYPQVD